MMGKKDENYYFQKLSMLGNQDEMTFNKIFLDLIYNSYSD